MPHLRQKACIVLNHLLNHPRPSPPQDKIDAIAFSYGAADVSYTPEAEAQIAKYTAMGLGGLPICMAKTQYSFSHEPGLKGGRRGVGA